MSAPALGAWSLVLGVIALLLWVLSPSTKAPPQNRRDPYSVRWKAAIRDNERKTA